MKKPKTKKTWDNKCCKLWGKLIKLKAGNCCEVCGASGTEKQMHPHHYIGRKNKLLKFEPRNGVCLCATHHTLGNVCAHQDPEWFRGWMKEYRSKDFKYICEQRKIPPRPFSIKEYEMACSALEKELLNQELQ